MRIFDFKRIEGPLHEADSARKCLSALLQLELCADSPIAVSLSHSKHMGMEVSLRLSVSRVDAGLHAGKRDSETDNGFRRSMSTGSGQIGIECADDLPADLLSDKECLTGNDIGFIVAPGFNLELYACLEFVVSVAG